MEPCVLAARQRDLSTAPIAHAYSRASLSLKEARRRRGKLEHWTELPLNERREGEKRWGGVVFCEGNSFKTGDNFEEDYAVSFRINGYSLDKCFLAILEYFVSGKVTSNGEDRSTQVSCVFCLWWILPVRTTTNAASSFDSSQIADCQCRSKWITADTSDYCYWQHFHSSQSLMVRSIKWNGGISVIWWAWWSQAPDSNIVLSINATAGHSIKKGKIFNMICHSYILHTCVILL